MGRVLRGWALLLDVNHLGFQKKYPMNLTCSNKPSMFGDPIQIKLDSSEFVWNNGYGA
jgi:hypothetical protein